MVLYYIRIAWRNMSRQVPFHALNIGGLAVGLAACIIISHYVFSTAVLTPISQIVPAHRG